MTGQPIIIYEDTAILVLDKPAGITVNTADTTKGEYTVQQFVEEKFYAKHVLSQGDETGESDFLKRAGIVHRLDKETSGILIIAKTPESFENLQKQFKDRTVKKTYVALVHGLTERPEGEITAPIGRLPWNRKRFGVIAEGREATTRYKVLDVWHYMFGKNKEPFSFLELYPQTGRTHQIRVHLKHIGHPIFADSLYAGRKTARDDRMILSRVFLHASSIGFSHPATGAPVAYQSPLPVELRTILENMRGKH